MRTAKACGPDPPTLGSSFFEMIEKATEANKPGLRGEHAISRKPLRRECRAIAACLTTCGHFFFSAHEDCGCGRAPGAPCALSFQRDTHDASLGRVSVAGMWSCGLALSRPILRDACCAGSSESDSKRDQYFQGLARRRVRSLRWATRSHATSVAVDPSKSRARRRQRPNHAKVRSTTQRRGKSWKPLTPCGL